MRLVIKVGVDRSTPQQGLQPACAVQCDEVGVAADMGLSDKDLWHRGAAGPRAKVVATRIVPGEVDLRERDALGFEEALRSGAVAAVGGGVDCNVRHETHVT